MKKVFLSILVCFVSIFSIAQSDANSSNLISEFLNSSDYVRISSRVSEFGSADLQLSKVVYFDNNPNKAEIHIFLSVRGVVKGLIQAIKIPQPSRVRMPNDDKYVMNLVDYSLFDIASKNGTIKTYDLNFENYNSATISVTNANISNVATSPIPTDVAARHPADGNGNGNVSYGECMHYMQAACYGQPTNCGTMCNLVNLAGGGSCTGSMAVSCVIIALFM